MRALRVVFPDDTYTIVDCVLVRNGQGHLVPVPAGQFARIELVEAEPEVVHPIVIGSGTSQPAISADGRWDRVDVP